MFRKLAFFVVDSFGEGELEEEGSEVTSYTSNISAHNIMVAALRP